MQILHHQIKTTTTNVEPGNIYEYCEIPITGKPYFADVKVLNIEPAEDNNYKLLIEIISAQQSYLPNGFTFHITTIAGKQEKGIWQLFDKGTHNFKP